MLPFSALSLTHSSSIRQLLPLKKIIFKILHKSSHFYIKRIWTCMMLTLLPELKGS